MSLLNQSINKSYFYSLIIYTFVCFSILLNSFLTSDGFLGPDSTNYLALAQNLINNGTYYLNYNGKENEWFAVWPAGYPTMIFIIAKITGVSVFLSSKILNLLIIGIIFIIFNYKFKESGYIFSSMFLFVPFLQVFSYTCSEVPFLLGMFLLSLSLYSYLQSQKINYLMLFIVTLSAIFLFLNRYIGAFSVGVIGLAFIYLLYIRSFQKAFLLIGPILTVITVAIFYLYNNYLLTGFHTGTERIPAPESILSLMKMTIKAFLVEFNLVTYNITFMLSNLVGKYFGFGIFLLVLFLQYYIFYYIFKKYSCPNNSLKLKDISQWKICLIIGLLYYAAIVYMRWTIHFDALGYRLLIPGTFLILISFILFSKKYLNSTGFNKFKITFIILAIVSYSIFTFKPYVKPLLLGSEIKTYKNFVLKLHEATSAIPVGSVIVMGDNHLTYLRPDLIKVAPKSDQIYLKNTESWDDFVYRVHKTYPNKNIYLYIKKLNEMDMVTDRFHSTVVKVIKENQDRKIMKLQ